MLSKAHAAEVSITYLQDVLNEKDEEKVNARKKIKKKIEGDINKMREEYEPFREPDEEQ